MKEVKAKLLKYQQFLKTQFSKQADKTSHCLELCMFHAFGACNEQHDMCSTEAVAFYEPQQLIELKIAVLQNGDVKNDLQAQIKESAELHAKNVSHLLRTRHQADNYKYVLNNLCPGEAAVIIDYKMKLELGVRTRGIQREWYGKRGMAALLLPR